MPIIKGIDALILVDHDAHFICEFSEFRIHSDSQVYRYIPRCKPSPSPNPPVYFNTELQGRWEVNDRRDETHPPLSIILTLILPPNSPSSSPLPLPLPIPPQSTPSAHTPYTPSSSVVKGNDDDFIVGHGLGGTGTDGEGGEANASPMKSQLRSERGIASASTSSPASASTGSSAFFWSSLLRFVFFDMGITVRSPSSFQTQSPSLPYSQPLPMESLSTPPLSNPFSNSQPLELAWIKFGKF
ncbi:hypothetical protein FB446DRAFT_795227 [Lentinula raphanica]|nr:hypothetical protein FB446DRAFT_795227 [Lentinula raphanica]